MLLHLFAIQSTRVTKSMVGSLVNSNILYAVMFMLGFRLSTPELTLHLCLLGNELSGNGIGTRISANQYAADVITLKSIVNEIYKNSTVKKPLVIAPGGFFDADWFSKLINQTKANSLDVISHHIYNLGPGN